MAHDHVCNIRVCDQRLVFAVRDDGMPGLFLAEGVTREQAADLLMMMAEELRRLANAG